MILIYGTNINQKIAGQTILRAFSPSIFARPSTGHERSLVYEKQAVNRHAKYQGMIAQLPILLTL